jgi:hypothetical protein
MNSDVMTLLEKQNTKVIFSGHSFTCAAFMTYVDVFIQEKKKKKERIGKERKDASEGKCIPLFLIAVSNICLGMWLKCLC